MARSLKLLPQIESCLENGAHRKVAFYPSAAISRPQVLWRWFWATSRECLQIRKPLFWGYSGSLMLINHDNPIPRFTTLVTVNEQRYSGIGKRRGGVEYVWAFPKFSIAKALPLPHGEIRTKERQTLLFYTNNLRMCICAISCIIGCLKLVRMSALWAPAIRFCSVLFCLTT